jgi:hypothetical protein
VTQLLIRQLYCDLAAKSPLTPDEDFSLLQALWQGDETKTLSGGSQSPRGDESFKIVQYDDGAKMAKDKWGEKVENTSHQ